MPHRAMSISSTRHAGALSFYATLAMLGLFHVTGKANHQWVTQAFDESGAALWAMLYFAGPVIAGVGAWVAPKYSFPKLPLWIEGAGCLLTAATNIAFGYAMFDSIGFEGAATTQTLLLGIATGMALRFAQIVGDQGRMKNARRAQITADPPPLAEADHTRG